MEAFASLVSRLIELHPLLLGIVATALAAVGLFGFIAIGSLFLSPSILASDDAGPSVSILIGSGVTAFIFAALTRFGFVDSAIVVVVVCAVLAIAVKREAIDGCIRSVIRSYRTVFGDSRFLAIAFLLIAVLLWVYSIAPPRDGDVMRYHLAHIRQIIRDGRWETIPDYHYAFPFGWTLNYLPFERIHIPEAAALLNAGLWLVIVAGLLHVAAPYRHARAARLGIIALFAHPFVIRTFGSAMADAYAILVVFVIAALVLKLEGMSSAGLTALGFASWIGVQSRYQHIAWGLAATVIVVTFLARRGAFKSILMYLVGVAAAVFLSAPFYLANARGLGNPFWPLLVPDINGLSAYSSTVAAAYTAAMTGVHEPRYVLGQIWDMMTAWSLFPIAILSIALILLCLRIADRRFRRVAILGALFFLIWMIAEPKFFPRHVLLLLPIAALLCVPVSDFASKWNIVDRVGTRVLVLSIVIFISVSAAFATDYVRYDFTGDQKTYHRFTWYYPTYDWVNHNTPASARFLVVTFSGHSYYLDRSYRRADPWLSGVVDWSRVSSASALEQVMMNGRYDYMIYDERDWTGFVGGAQMQSAVADAIRTGVLEQIHSMPERLYTSRTMRDFDQTEVSVYRRVMKGSR